MYSVDNKTSTEVAVNLYYSLHASVMNMKFCSFNLTDNANNFLAATFS